VERSAGQSDISLRGGCFCNPGAAEAAFQLPRDEAFRCMKSMPRGSFTLEDFAGCMGDDVPVGAMRASLGVASSESDLERLRVFLREFVAELGRGSRELASAG
jgi:selenocysteine lyase/cysteine desulfurase